MKIKEVTIKGLYNRSLSLELDTSLTILCGSNGSYKSTFLRIVDAMCNNKPTVELEKTTSVKIYLTNNETLSYNKDEKELREIQSELHAGFVSTFDVPIIYDDRKDYLNNSILDQQLIRLEEDYAYYLSGLAQQMGREVRANGKIHLNRVEEIYSNSTLFTSYINNLFSETQKEIKQDSSKLEFVTEKYDKTLSSHDLSSGEKQILILLLSVLLQKKKESILLLDEPEISLHISWQSRLIDILLALNPNLQLIISTHSPSIFGKGWGNKVVYMEDIIK